MSGKYAYTALPAVVTPLVLPALWNPDWDFPGIAPPGWVPTDNEEQGEDGKWKTKQGSILVTPLTGLVTTSEGGNDVVQVRLSKPLPTLLNTVNVPIESSKMSVCTLSDSVLTFTGADWDVDADPDTPSYPRNVTLYGQHVEGPPSISYTIRTGPATGDPLYSGKRGGTAHATHYTELELTVFSKTAFFQVDSSDCRIAGSQCGGRGCDHHANEIIGAPGCPPEEDMPTTTVSLLDICNGLQVADPSENTYNCILRAVYTSALDGTKSNGVVGFGVIGTDGKITLTDNGMMTQNEYFLAGTDWYSQHYNADWSEDYPNAIPIMGYCPCVITYLDVEVTRTLGDYSSVEFILYYPYRG